MRSPYTQIFMHFVWSTWDRHPFLTDDVRPRIYDGIQAVCREMQVDVVAIGGVEDHVHVLVRMPPTVAPSTLVKHMKGSSTHLINYHTGAPFFFKWQGGYGAFSVSKRLVPRVREYILDQEAHHRMGTVFAEVEPG